MERRMINHWVAGTLIDWPQDSCLKCRKRILVGQDWIDVTNGDARARFHKHEILLVGTRGHVPAPAMGTQWSSLILAPVGRHSEKPEAFCEMIESYFPTLPKIELHARGVVSRPGWDVWGLEAPSTAELRRPDAGLRQETIDRLA
jgi:N6-adenosine-specific RNA methylase IME4